MKREMKQTAVEWLVSALDALDEQMKVAPKTTNYKSTRESIIKQAKEIEKEQVRTILLAYNEERNDRTDGAQNYWDPYEVDDFLEEYNETFKANEK